MKSTKSLIVCDEIILQGMFFCPYGKESASCFFQWLQKKTTKEKVEWFNSLTLRDKQDLMYSHSKCNCNQMGDPMKLKFFQKN